MNTSPLKPGEVVREAMLGRQAAVAFWQTYQQADNDAQVGFVLAEHVESGAPMLAVIIDGEHYGFDLEGCEEMIRILQEAIQKWPGSNPTEGGLPDLCLSFMRGAELIRGKTNG